MFHVIFYHDQNNAIEGISGPQLSPESLRQQAEDPPSLTSSPNEEIVRERHSELTLENIIIPEEAVQTEQETASKETESPGQGFQFVDDVEKVRRVFRKLDSFGKAKYCRTTKWYEANIHRGVIPLLDAKITSKFTRLILRCKKPKIWFDATRFPEPCNSSAYAGCMCSPGTPSTPSPSEKYHQRCARKMT